MPITAYKLDHTHTTKQTFVVGAGMAAFIWEQMAMMMQSRNFPNVLTQFIHRQEKGKDLVCVAPSTDHDPLSEESSATMQMRHEYA